MNNQELIKEAFQKAILGFNDQILSNHENWFNHVINLPEKLQVVYTIGVLNQQVLNGGFEQYFFNPYGQFAYLTVQNLKLIDAYAIENLLDKAIIMVNKENLEPAEFGKKIFNREIDLINNFDKELNENLEKLDKEYYSFKDDLENLMANYLLKVS